MIKFVIVGRTPIDIHPPPPPPGQPEQPPEPPRKGFAPDALDKAVHFALKQGWTRIGATRYASQHKDDIRVIERLSELVLGGGVVTMIRGPGFNENLHAEDFEALVEQGAARWDE